MTNMNHSLEIILSSAEGAVIRTLGLIERRGFGLDSCSVGEILDNRRAMEVSVTSTRRSEVFRTV